MSFILAHMD